MANPPVAPDVAHVVKRNRTLLYRHIATRLALAVVLFAVPFVAHLVGWDAALPAFGIPATLFVLIFLMLRLRHGSRLRVCERVLRLRRRQVRAVIGDFTEDMPQVRSRNASTALATVRNLIRGRSSPPETSTPSPDAEPTPNTATCSPSTASHAQPDIRGKRRVLRITPHTDPGYSPRGS
ncbi:hypothetical protein ACFOZ0_33855 [Streptomyces yaanensis]|uniref:Uncharacterized protein n=1 Tax=Streptomyces yaanensis TaxID=1142239 RepID=A0ABV7SPP7_9ACTN|nr:hypothetical protein [Streptomyces sp. CGMCC 4.7035]WNB98137.1 hypothetical protein Q2K21_08635 [Streptomyces sp. CGMCC 4.7035]